MSLAASCLHEYGQIACSLGYSGKPVTFGFSQAKDDEGDKVRWRITANPLAWGNPHAEIIVLGFSKGRPRPVQ
jgi:hypothetical protein